jgi:hypothetical protein
MRRELKAAELLNMLAGRTGMTLVRILSGTGSKTPSLPVLFSGLTGKALVQRSREDCGKVLATRQRRFCSHDCATETLRPVRRKLAADMRLRLTRSDVAQAKPNNSI